MKKDDYTPLTVQEEIQNIVREWFSRERHGDSHARERASKLLEEYLVETEDGTFTVASESSEDGFKAENMHTIHGAFREAREKFVKPANLDVKSNFATDKVAIMDICSGLGYNAAAALEAILNDFGDNHPESHENYEEKIQIKIDMVEISPETLGVALLIPSPDKSHSIVRKAIEEKLIEEGFLTQEMEKAEIPPNLEIRVHCMDARDYVKSLQEDEKSVKTENQIETQIKYQYDAIFLDPFSPGKSPELYNVEFFQELKKLIKDDGMILTYTSAAPVRYGLIEAGFEVGEGPQVGRKGGTIASPSLERIKKGLSMDDERMIALSDAGIPFHDLDLSASSKIVAKKRQEEREKVRGITKFASTVRTPTYLNRKIDDPRLERRVLKQLKKLGIDSLESPDARYLICPQFVSCICTCQQGRFKGSANKIKEMERRLELLLEEE